MLGSRGDPTVRRRRPARRHHRPDVRRLGRPVVRRVPARAASRCGWRATPTTTSARACPAGGSSLRPSRGRHVRGRAQRHRRQRHPVRRDVRRGVPARRRGGAVRRAQLRCVGGRRGRRRPRLRVHDRRPGGRARADRAQLRRRHVAAGSRTCSTWTRRWSTGSWSTWSRCTPATTTWPACSTWSSRHAEETGSPVATALVDACAVDPSAVLSRVTRVMPRDYRRVLAERG